MARYNEEELSKVEKQPEVREVPICVTQEEMFNLINQKLDFIISRVK